MTKQIQLTLGLVALVDDADFETLNQHKWQANKKSTDTFYAVRHKGKRPIRRMVKMAREIMDAPSDLQVDHINGNTLDNRRSNLRLCTHSENSRNRRKPTNNISGYKGVSWNSQRGKWLAKIKLNGKVKFIGRYTNPEDAARAYDKKARELHGEFARTNF